MDEAVKAIVADPNIGDLKKGDLRDVRVYKYKTKSQQLLVAYHYKEDTIILLAHGAHENFYRTIKRNL